MEEFIYEEDLYPIKEEVPTPQLITDEPQKPSYTNRKKNKKKKTGTKKTFKERLRDDVFIRRAGTIIAVVAVLIWALVSALNNVGGNLLENFVKGLGFENVAQFEMVLNEFNTDYTPNIQTTLESMPEDNLFKMLNNDLVDELLDGDVKAQILGWDADGKIVLKLDITKLKNDAKPLGVTLPSSIYVSFIFDWGDAQITNIWFNEISSESNSILLTALGGNELQKAVAESLNAWLSEQSND